MEASSQLPAPGGWAMFPPPTGAPASPGVAPLRPVEQAGAVTPTAPAEGSWSTPLALAGELGTLRLLYCRVFKRWFDVAVASVALVALAPLLLLVALAIRLDSPGPVIFRQPRVGRGGRPFVVFKFRTMRPDRRRSQAPYAGLDRRLSHKTRHDPRVTRLGRVLRRTSLDELPQLLNVVRGEMSLIGPRPELTGVVEGYAPWQHGRHVVRPGLTGWWQVRGRSDRPMHENTELDLYYVEHQSAALDARILLETVRVVLFGKGAF